MDTDFKTQALGAVLPVASPTSKLEPGTHAIAIDGIDDSGMVRCVYPGGFVKHHQAETVTELAEKVARQVRGRYGVQDVPFATAPAEIAAGESFTVEV